MFQIRTCLVVVFMMITCWRCVSGDIMGGHDVVYQWTLSDVNYASRGRRLVGNVIDVKVKLRLFRVVFTLYQRKKGKFM